MTRMVRLTLVAAMLIVTLMALAGPTGVSNNSTLAATRPLDLVILIDTTGSMGDDIDAVKARSSEIVNSILGDFPNARIAVIDYRDFPEWTAWEEDYPYRDVQRFSSNATEINNSINTLELGYGGDWPESLWCALMHAMVNDGCAGKGAATTIADADGVGWRSDARKAIIYLTDAPAHDPEPYTDFTIASVQSAAASGGFEVTSSAATTRKLAAVDSGISLFPVIIGGDSEAVEQGRGRDPRGSRRHRRYSTGDQPAR
jgi:hypothetical protein